MALTPPVLDNRSLADIIERLRQLAASDVPEWNPPAGGDAGVMLHRMFARLLELAIARLNGVPEKNLFAFLDAMGVSPLAPSPARVPLTFSLKPGTPATLVPRGTQAGTAPGGSAPQVSFETLDDLTVIPAQIARIVTMDPVWDRYTDVSGSGATPGFTPFVGSLRMPHVLNLGHDSLLDFTSAVIDLEPLPPFDNRRLQPVQIFLASLQWQCLQGGTLRTLAPPETIATTLTGPAAVHDVRITVASTAALTLRDAVTIRSAAAAESAVIAALEPGNVVRLSAPLQNAYRAGSTVSLNSLGPALRLPAGVAIDRTTLRGPSPHPSIRDGIVSRWIQGVFGAPVTDLAAGEGQGLRNVQLRVSADGLTPDFVFSDSAPLDVTKEALPFGASPREGSTLYIGSREAMSKPNARVFLHVDVKPAPPPTLMWEYWTGRSWSRIPNAVITKDGNRIKGPTIAGDGTNGFTTPGTIEIPRPSDLATATGGAQSGQWFRIRIESGTYSGAPEISKFSFNQSTVLSENAAPGARAIKLREANFAGIGSVLQIGEDADPAREVVQAVVESFTAVVSGIQVAPGLRSPHASGTVVRQRGVSPPVATLRDSVAAANATAPRSFIINTAEGISTGDILMIDDPGRREFVVVTDVEPAFFEPMLTAVPPVAGTVVPVSNIVSPQGSLQSSLTFTPVGATLAPNAFTQFIIGYKITARDPLLFPHAENVAVRRVTPDHVLALVNWDLVDVTQPFYPFGANPGPSSLFYFVAGTAFPPVIHIDVDLRMTSPNVRLQWEVLGAGGWTAVDLESDETDDFVRSGDIVVPPNAYAPGDVNGKNGNWLRVRIAEGNYGLPAAYAAVDPADASKGFTVKAGTANLNPPVIRGLSLGYEARGTPSVVTQDGFAFLDQTPASPFPRIVPVRSVSDSALGIHADPQPAWYVGFNAASPGWPASLFVAATPRTFSGSISKEGASNPASAAGLPAVRWQYFDGTIWRNLTTFDGTNSLTESGLLEFLTPDDIAPLAKFDLTPRYWIRALSAANDPADTQTLDGIFFNTVPAIQAITVTTETLGSSNGLPAQSFRLARTPVLDERIFVHEPESPPAEELAALERMAGVDAVERRADPVTGEPQVWVRWMAVPNFLRSGPSSRHYTLDPAAGAVTFGDGIHGLIPPKGALNVTATYRAGGGQSGNRAPAAIAQIKSPVPGVSSVTNPILADGGADVETVAMVRDRGPWTLRHRDRALTSGDMEWLARQAAGTRVARAKCIPNVNRDLRFEPGWSTVLIVPSGTENRLSPSSELIGEVEDYLAARAFAGMTAAIPSRINVIGPGYIRVAVQATIVPRDIGQADQVKRRVVDAIASFFHPLTGGPMETGWEFSRDVYESEVYQLLEAVDGVSYVKTLQLVPDIAQYLLVLDSATNASASLPEGSRVSTSDLRKSALLAEALAGGAIPRLAVKGFKQGDRIAAVLDLTVVSVAGQQVTVAPFDAGGVGFPDGSRIARFDGSDETVLAEAIRRGDSAQNRVVLASAQFASGLQAGDVLTVFSPFPMTIVTVASGSGGAQALGIAPYQPDGDLSVGTVVATLDNRVRLPLSIAIPANQPVSAIVVQGLMPGDSVLLTPSDGAFQTGPAQVAAIAAVTSVVYLDDNFLVYPGQHRIVMEGV